MEPSTKQLGALGAAALVAAAAVFVISKGPDGKPYETSVDAVGDVPVLVAKDLEAQLVAESKLATLDDGGLAAYVELRDGGLALLDAMPCARRPKGADVCTLLDGGDPGNWNRYPTGQLVGPQCEPVPCSVWAGQKADPDQP